MKIRMITLAAGPCGVFQPGKVYTVEDVVGAPMVAGAYAVRLDVPVEVKVPPAPLPPPPHRGRSKR